MSDITTASVTFAARDGYLLAGAWHVPSDRPAAAVAVIGSAIGVPQAYYRPFAEHLAASGMGTLTFDYRGIGASRPARLRGFRARLDEWGRWDLSAAIDWVSQGPGRDLPLGYVGHSVGGQIFGLAENCPRAQAALTVASQDGYWGNWPAPRKYLLAAFWWGVLPPLTGVLGYCPSRALGLGEDLPAGVGQDWARWARTRGYLHRCLGDRERQGYRQFRGPLLAYSFADDTFAPRASVEGLLAFYPQAAGEHRHVHPHEIGAQRVGHFGFFRPGQQPTLWRDAAAWLTRQLTGAG